MLDLLEQTGFINQEIGSKARSQRTRITAGDRLIEAIAEARITPADIGQTGEQQTIVLKNGWKQRLQYRDTEQVHEWRTEMETINRTLAAANISVDHRNNPGLVTIDSNKRRLYRVFTRGSFNLHGRLYGGFWIPMKKQERLKAIRIDGQPVLGLDYGQTFPRIAYGWVGAEPPQGDLYVMPGVEAYRDGMKELMNAMINYEKDFVRKPKDIREKLPPHMSVEKLQDLIRSHHEPIADFFGSDMGQELTYCESKTIISVMLRLIDEGVVALPIHDCIIVRHDNGELATNIMLEELSRITGATGVIKKEVVEEGT